MEIGILIIKIILTVILLPVFGALFIDKAKNLEATLPKWRKFSISNVHFWTSIVSLIALIFIEVYSYNRSKPVLVEENLEFLSIDTYKDELEKKVAKIDSLPNKEESVKELLRKFQHAEYAWKTKDSDEVIKTLNELFTGKDMNGDFLKIQSFVVLNNLGVAFFHKQRNKEFRSSSFLQEALNAQEVNSLYKESILNNFRKLDSMSNNLD